jgi:predicted DNA-binding WGR domain protein
MSSKLTLPELKSLCKENKIKGYSKLKKDEIIQLLKDNNIQFKQDDKKDKVEKESSDNSSDDSSKDSTDSSTEKTKLKNEIKKETTEELDSSMKNELTKLYVFKDDKSSKFWEIKYENSDEEKRKYIVRYGKVDTNGTSSKPKMDTLKNINKIIDAKLKKGYVIMEVETKESSSL